MKKTLHCMVFAALALLGGAVSAMAHPIPETTIELTVDTQSVRADVTIPLNEFALAFDLSTPVTDETIAAQSPQIAQYLADHTHADGWSAMVSDVALSTGQTDEGSYAELVATIHLEPSTLGATGFDLYYDAVLERVVTHNILVSFAGETDLIGVIYAEPKDGSVAPLHIDLNR